MVSVNYVSPQILIHRNITPVFVVDQSVVEGSISEVGLLGPVRVFEEF